MLIDAGSIDHDAEYTCDLCVVGGGPAGIALVERLRGSGLSIILAESGGFHPEAATQRLYTGDVRGHQYFPLDVCRWRWFGGGTNRWGGWLRNLDPSDFELQDWIPCSGWPITDDTLKPYYADTARIFGLPTESFHFSSWRERLPPPIPLEHTNFDNVVIQYKATNFSQTYRDRFVKDRSVLLMLHANLMGIELAPNSNKVQTLRIGTLTNRRFSIRPRAVVLATGGLENARLLLASRSDRSNGLGNEFDLVGRYFMEHLHVGAGHMILKRSVANRRFYDRNEIGDIRVGGVIAPTPEALQRHHLINASIAVEPAGYSVGRQRLRPKSLPFSTLGSYQKVRTSRLRPFVETAERHVDRVASLSRKYRTWRKAQDAQARAIAGMSSDHVYSLYVRSAQVPNPESRVTLSSKRDVLGILQIELNWQLTPFDVKSIYSWLSILGQDMVARDLGRVLLPPEGWESEIVGGPHHMGTTRMAADPRRGVVDEECRVHSVDNLYVAGSSVFPTGGYANPTFTLVALALRLADTLRGRLLTGPTLTYSPKAPK